MVCVCPKRGWFFYINSAPYRKVSEVNVEIRNFELPGLPNEISYLDTRRVTRLTAEQVRGGMDKQGSRQLGCLSPTLSGRVKAAIHGHGILPQYQEEVILENL